jgi:hypothetical protein
MRGCYSSSGGGQVTKRKVVREITYEGDPEWLEIVLKRSLPDGAQRFSKYGTVTVRTVSNVDVVEPDGSESKQDGCAL